MNLNGRNDSATRSICIAADDSRTFVSLPRSVLRQGQIRLMIGSLINLRLFSTPQRDKRQLMVFCQETEKKTTKDDIYIYIYMYATSRKKLTSQFVIDHCISRTIKTIGDTAGNRCKNTDQLVSRGRRGGTSDWQRGRATILFSLDEKTTSLKAKIIDWSYYSSGRPALFSPNKPIFAFFFSESLFSTVN